jgi:hypothetical protein
LEGERATDSVSHRDRYGLHESLEPLERALIKEGAIQATGFRWVGERNSPW